MAYREISASMLIADTSACQSVEFQRKVTFYRKDDLEVFVTTRQVGIADVEAQVSIAPISLGYSLWISSDYPVLVRLNGVSATQFQLTPNTVGATNLGTIAPDNCVWDATIRVTSIYIAPISGATQTATVKICVTGDPAVSY